MLGQMLGVRPHGRFDITFDIAVPSSEGGPSFREKFKHAIRCDRGAIKSGDTRARGLGATAELSKENRRRAVLDPSDSPREAGLATADTLLPHRDVLWDSVLLQRGGSIAGVLGPG